MVSRFGRLGGGLQACDSKASPIASAYGERPKRIAGLVRSNHVRAVIIVIIVIIVIWAEGFF